MEEKGSGIGTASPAGATGTATDLLLSWTSSTSSLPAVHHVSFALHHTWTRKADFCAT